MTSTIATTILDQLGGNRFLVMTGCKNLVDLGNGIRMTIPKNAGKANRLDIILDKASDSYTMRFYNYKPMKVNNKTFAVTDEKTVEISTRDDVYCDQLQAIFTSETGMYTHL